MSISQNLEAGVLVRDQACPKINNNRIYGNSKQGVVLEENSSAFIMGNSIYRNIKANVALGGIGSGTSN
jgi:parallel beta-helix repeat protein